MWKNNVNTYSSFNKIEMNLDNIKYIDSNNFFPELCRTCLMIIKENIPTICVEANDLNAEKISFYNKLFLCCPELDLRVHPKAILCERCFKTVNDINKFIHKFCKSVRQVQSTILNKRTKLQKTPQCLQNDSHETSTIDLPEDTLNTAEKPFKCTQCNYCSVRKGDLKNHLRIHSREKPFKCNQCNYSSVRNGDLKVHVRFHTKEKAFKCSQCAFSTSYSSSLKTHSRTHTGEKPYTCTHCSYSTIYGGDLKTHVRIHTGEKPYKCSRCDYCSTHKSHVKKHMLRHSEKEINKCFWCDYIGVQRSDLVNHVIDKHSYYKTPI